VQVARVPLRILDDLPSIAGDCRLTLLVPKLYCHIHGFLDVKYQGVDCMPLVPKETTLSLCSPCAVISHSRNDLMDIPFFHFGYCCRSKQAKFVSFSLLSSHSLMAVVYQVWNVYIALSLFTVSELPLSRRVSLNT